MKIPELFRKKLNQDQKLNGIIDLNISEFEEWLNSDMPFFPEYTKHDMKHVADVLLTAEGLINDESWEIISSEDIAVLILAILLHDSALHLKEDGFIQLIDPNTKYQPIKGLKDKPWSIIWEDFIGEATRFDGKKLMELFGDTEPIHRPTLDIQKMTRRDRILIGEFLRRHHSRLAHEIAIYGVPGPKKEKIKFKNVDNYLAEISGLIARSHGLSIRSCFNILETRKLREFKNIHIVYLMVLLRISDYLQIQEERAPNQLLKVQELRSPVSKGEWKAHHAIIDINTNDEDPEAIYIEAKPMDVKIFLKLRNLLELFQKELDISWSILGEIYGRFIKFRNLGLTIRRIHSNIFDVDTFSKSVDYLPYLATFKTADADLLKLLINPLYSKSPEIGIRELLQNAVDACRELNDYLSYYNNIPNLDIMKQDTNVIISLEEQNSDKWVIISDQGIGMTYDIILNYFLKIGSTYRLSDSWKKIHEDKSGKSRVLRSGRFGIGILATFLLGNEIQVSTRHVSQENGIEFKALLESDIIELKRISRPIGTKIMVKITDNEIWNELINNKDKWDWFCLSEPTVIRLIKSNKKKPIKIEQEYNLPLPKEKLPPSWHRISHPDFNVIHWTYNKICPLSCNGIIIKLKKEYFPHLIDNDYYEISTPNVSVFDPDGKLPLNLQRTEVIGNHYPFKDQLLDDVIKNLLSYFLVNTPSEPILNKISINSYLNFQYPGLKSKSIFEPYICSNKGISLFDNWHIKELNPSNILILPNKKDELLKLCDIYELNSNNINFPDMKIIYDVSNLHWGHSMDGIDPLFCYCYSLLLKKFLNKPQNRFYRLRENIGPLFNVSIDGFRALIDTYRYGKDYPTDDLLKFMSKKELEVKEDNEIISDVKKVIETSAENVFLMSIGNCPNKSTDFNKLSKCIIEYNSKKDNHYSRYSRRDRYFNTIIEIYISNISQREPSYISSAWKRIIGDPIIPYNLNERKNKLHNAFEKLDPYIKNQMKQKRMALPLELSET